MLVKEKQKNNQFWGLWQRYQGGLYKKCLKMMKGDEAEAEDALSIAMLRAREKVVEKSADINNFKGWISRLTENICIDQIRRKKKQESWDEGFEEGWSHGICQSINHESLENQVQREDLANRIYEVVMKLPSTFKGPVLLRFFLNLSYHKIAKHYHLTNTNIRKRIQRAREILDKELKGKIKYSWKSCLFIEIKNLNLPTWEKIKKESEKILNESKSELEVHYTSSQRIRIILPGGGEKKILVYLMKEPKRKTTRIKTLEKYIAQYPKGWKKRMELAELLYSNGEWDRAIDELQIIIERQSCHLEAYLLLGEIFRQREEREKAIQVYKAVQQVLQKESTLKFFESLINQCDENWQESNHLLKEAIRLEPENILFGNTLAFSYIKLGQIREALGILNKILKKNPGNHMAQIYKDDATRLEAGNMNKLKKS
jgi:RNA polymerase sigma factor (sigma-70 family)